MSIGCYGCSAVSALLYNRMSLVHQIALYLVHGPFVKV